MSEYELVWFRLEVLSNGTYRNWRYDPDQCRREPNEVGNIATWHSWWVKVYKDGTTEVQPTIGVTP